MTNRHHLNRESSGADSNSSDTLERSPSAVYKGGGYTEGRVKLKDKMSLMNQKSQMGSLDIDVKTGKSVEATKLTTFTGVFVPTVQNIMGIILFVRVPWITGQAGILQALVVVIGSCVTTIITSLSMGAVATNGVPQSGGCYSIIKNSLGPEFGGTVGLMLFLSNTFGVAMYILAFVEVFMNWNPGKILGDDCSFAEIDECAIGIRPLGAIVLFFLSFIVYIGIEYIKKTSLAFLFVVLLSVISIWLGVVTHSAANEGEGGSSDQWADSHGLVGMTGANLEKNLGPGYTYDEEECGGRAAGQCSFAVVLSIFFPAVTDPLAGSNLSGDLRTPQQSIPIGTILAVLVTTLVFCLQVVLVGGSVERETLLTDRTVVAILSWPVKELVFMGMCLSTMGAGLQSLAGAPRLLAAIAKDRLLPRFEIFEPPEGQEPRKALALITILSTACVMIGSLNAVAPYITMLFLTSYGIINGACAYLAYEQSPTFRPTWHFFDWRLSCLGALMCFSGMFFISELVAGICVVAAIALYLTIQRQINLDHKADTSSGGETQIKTDWRAGRRFQAARQSLLALKDGDLDFKYWRPFILFLCKVDKTDEGKYVPQKGMINLISQLMKRGKGLSIVAGVVEGEFADHVELLESGRKHLQEKLVEKKIEGFSEMVCARSIDDGHRFLLHSKGMGVLRPNTVMIGWPDEPATMEPSAMSTYCGLVKEVELSKKTLLICKGAVDFPENDAAPLEGFVDVWWVFDLFPANGLLLLLPYLLQKHRVWRHTTTRLFTVAPPETDLDELRSLVEGMVSSGGMVAKVKVITMSAEDAPRFADAAVSTPALHELEGRQRRFSETFDHLERNTLNTAASLATESHPHDTLSTMAEEEPSSILTMATSGLEAVLGGGGGGGEGDEATLGGGGGGGGEAEAKSDIEQGERERPSGKKTRRSSTVVDLNTLDADEHGSKLTALIGHYSGSSPLVIMTLPKKHANMTPAAWLTSVDTLASPLDRVIFVHESGQEKIQFFSE